LVKERLIGKKNIEQGISNIECRRRKQKQTLISWTAPVRTGTGGLKGRNIIAMGNAHRIVKF